MNIELDKFEEGTVICALVNYALAIADPEECIRVLEKLVPNPKRPWRDIVFDARRKARKIYDAAGENRNP
jgi:hypothetical protein